MSRKFNPVFSLEDDNNEVVPQDDNLDIDSLNGDGADAALLELQDAQGEADDNDADIDNLENSAVALESLLETAESSLEEGGLDPVAAELLQKAVENETAPLGTPVSEVVPALEGFSSASSRKEQTIMACEGIKETVAKIWAKIKELIQKGREILKKVYIQAKQAVQSLERRVNSLEADMKNRNFSMPKAQKVSVNAAWADPKANKATAEAIEYMLGDGVQGPLVQGLNRIAQALKDGKAEEVANASRAMGESFKGYKSTDHLAGGRKLVNEEGIVQLRSVKSGTEGTSNDVPVLKEADLKAMIEGLKATVKTVVAYEKDFQAGDRAKEAVLHAGDELEKKVAGAAKGKEGEDEGTSAAVANAREAANHAREAVRAFDHPAKELLSYAASYVSGVGAVVAAHLKAYDKK